MGGWLAGSPSDYSTTLWSILQAEISAELKDFKIDRVWQYFLRLEKIFYQWCVTMHSIQIIQLAITGASLQFEAEMSEAV